MKVKHILWFLTGIVAVVAMAAGVAVVVDRLISRKECPEGYIECDTQDDTEIEE